MRIANRDSLGFAAVNQMAGELQNISAVSAMQNPEVEVASVVQKDVPIFNEWVATLDGYVNAQRHKAR